MTAAATTGTWSYNANNEVNQYDDASYQYDDKGNTTKKTVGGRDTNYVYGVEDRLTRVEDGQGSVIAQKEIPLSGH